MIQSSIRNSSLNVYLTLQYWPDDSFMPFIDAMIKREFIMNPPSASPRPLLTLARKGTTSGVGIDYPNRRVFVQITNNINSPDENVTEILSILSNIGYESIERIDINGNIIISLEGSLASTLFTSVIQKNFTEKVNQIFERPITPTGIRIASTDPISGDISRNPFVVLIEPLLTDPNDTTLFVQVFHASRSSDHGINFLKTLYGALKEIIMASKNV